MGPDKFSGGHVFVFRGKGSITLCMRYSDVAAYQLELLCYHDFQVVCVGFAFQLELVEQLALQRLSPNYPFD